MEKNIAILMADLSGYSALTETHGAVSAADLVDKFIGIAESCLVGDCKLHQQTGDELMFVSDSADMMLATAQRLAVETASEAYFLQVHGGMHYGKVLQRGGNYFGTAINITARVAAKAIAGTFYCSAEFVNAIADKSAAVFESRGNHLLKNIHAERELFELNIQKVKTNYIDPVCRMLILNQEHAFRHPIEDRLYFCSSQCLRLYKENERMGDTMQHPD